ncbi:MAG TPA: NosD domain-containing protein, partial [Usitatibacter sp.]|nr:NosD domain-containing protein [Usitatibacter sp.]
MSLLRLASTLLAAVFGIASAPGAAAATINVTAGQNLNQILEDAAAGDVVVVGPGTYTAQGTVCLPNAAQFSIRKPLTVMSSDGPEATILQQPDTGGPLPAVLITHGVCTSSFVADVVLEGFTLVDGVAVATQGIPAQRIRLGNLLVNSSAPRPGVSFENARDSTIDGSVVDVLGRAISVTNSRDVFVTNNSLRTTGATQAVYLDQTLNSVVAGNTVWGAGADAILLSATTSSRFERNTISGHRYDGIRVTNGVSASSSNFIGYNTIVSNGWAGGIETSGNGIVLS